MKITMSEIKRIVHDDRNLMLARRYYMRNLIESVSIDYEEEKGVYHVRGTVTQPPYSNDIQITVYSSGVGSYACVCPYCNAHTACAHIGAVLLFIQDVEPEHFPYAYERDVYDTYGQEEYLEEDETFLKKKEEAIQQALQMQERRRKEYQEYLETREQQKRETEKVHAKLLIEQSKNTLHQLIQPVYAAPIHVQLGFEGIACNNEYYVNGFIMHLRVGHKKLYVVKNIEEFLRHIDEEDVVTYGKYLSFKHSIDIFDESSQEVIKFLRECIHYFLNSYLGRAYKEVVVPEKFMDQFFALTQNLSEEYLDFSVVEEPMQLSIHVDNEMEDFVVSLLYPRKNSPLLAGSAHFYEFKNNQLIQRTLDASGYCMELYHKLNHERLLVDADDIEDFHQYVLGECEPYLSIEGKELLPNLLVETSIELKADVDEEGSISIALICYFDDYKMHGFSSDNEKKPLHLRLIEDYIKEYSSVVDYDLHVAYIDSNSDISIAFVEEGLQHLSKYCDVYVSDALKNMNKQHPIHMQVGVRISNHLLEVNFDSTDINKDEIYDVLRAYRRKKKFHRLQNGKLLMLESKELEETSQILEDLDVSLKDCQDGKVTLPLYRTLYMDEMLQRESTLDVERKKTFDTFVSDFQNASNKKVVFPAPYDTILRDYQKEGFTWLKRMNYFHFSGILADDMGLGKTLQVIALLESEKAEDRTSIVVVPASLLLNWMDEIQKFTKELSFLCIMGSSGERKEQIKEWHKVDILITSYDYLRRDIEEYEKLSFYYVILDEAQYIKNQKTKNAVCVKMLKAEHRLALTGTPIENSLAELWSIFDFLMPGYLYNYHYFQTHFEKDIVANRDEDKQKKLKRMVEPFILRRNKKEVLQELPDKIEKNMTITFDDEEKKLYMANFAKASKELQEKLSMDKVDKFAILSILMKLRQLCCEPSLVYDNFTRLGSKRQGCLELIRSLKDNHAKILLFSSFTSMLDLLADDLREEHISYFMLTGKTPKDERRQLVQKFQEGQVDVFLISLKAGGTGLNLTAAQAVIHYDPWWNVSAQNQATDRAHRIGQEETVQVFRLIMKDSIEEKIQKLQQKKKNLADSFVEGNDGSIQNMKMDDIIDLFSLKV